MEMNIDELRNKRMSLVERFEVVGIEKKDPESSQDRRDPGIRLCGRSLWIVPCEDCLCEGA